MDEKTDSKEPRAMLRHAENAAGGCQPWCEACLADTAEAAAQEIVPGELEVTLNAKRLELGRDFEFDGPSTIRLKRAEPLQGDENLVIQGTMEAAARAYNKQQLAQALMSIGLRLHGIMYVLEDGMVHLRRARSGLAVDEQNSSVWMSRAAEVLRRVKAAVEHAPYLKEGDYVRLKKTDVENIAAVLAQLSGPRTAEDCKRCDVSVGLTCESCSAHAAEDLLRKLLVVQEGLNLP